MLKIKTLCFGEKKTLRKGTELLCLIAAVYLSLVIYLSIFDSLKFFWMVPLLVAILWISIIYMVSNVKYDKRCLENKNINHIKLFITIFLEIFLFQLLYWLSFYPGGFNLDAYGQWDQIHGLQKLNNWHPVFTTMCYWILIKINDSLSFCIFIQLFLFTLVVSKLLVKLVKYGVPHKIIYLVAFIIGINPAVGMNNVCLIKDVPFAICIVCFLDILLEVYYTNGEWLEKIKNILLLIFLIVIMQMIRHNSVFFSAPVVLLLLLYKKMRQQVVSVLLLSISLFLFIVGPVFNACKVVRHENIIGEMVGVPMAIMANALLDDYQEAPHDVKAVLLKIAPLDDWKNNYHLGEWDSCKWEFGGTELLKREKVSTIMRLAIETIKQCPDSAYKSFRENTRVVWQMIGENEWETEVYIEENDYGIILQNNSITLQIVNGILHFCSGEHSVNVWNNGIYLFLFIFGICVVYENNREKELMFLVPSVIYFLATMLLLSGPSYRYFYFINIIFLPVTLIIAFIQPLPE